jgi:primosomal protein N'
MSLIDCPHCGARVSALAEDCPRCGRLNPAIPGWGFGVAAVAGVAIVAVLVHLLVRG